MENDTITADGVFGTFEAASRPIPGAPDFDYGAWATVAARNPEGIRGTKKETS